MLVLNLGVYAADIPLVSMDFSEINKCIVNNDLMTLETELAKPKETKFYNTLTYESSRGNSFWGSYAYYAMGYKSNPYIIACDNNNKKAVDLLLKYKFAPVFSDDKNRDEEGVPQSSDIIYYCIYKNNTEMLSYFYSIGLGLENDDSGVMTAIQYGCSDETILFLWDKQKNKNPIYINHNHSAGELSVSPFIFFLYDRKGIDAVLKYSELLKLTDQLNELSRFYWIWEKAVSSIYDRYKNSPEVDSGKLQKLKQLGAKSTTEILMELPESTLNAIYNGNDSDNILLLIIYDFLKRRT